MHFSHHSGTEKQAVARDYADRLDRALITVEVTSDVLPCYTVVSLQLTDNAIFCVSDTDHTQMSGITCHNFYDAQPHCLCSLLYCTLL